MQKKDFIKEVGEKTLIPKVENDKGETITSKGIANVFGELILQQA